MINGGKYLVNAMCIGGPYDGRCMMLDDDRDWFRCAVVPPMPLLPLSNDPVELVSYEAVTYTRRDLFGVIIWVPDSMRTHDVMQLLYMRYFHGDKSKD